MQNVKRLLATVVFGVAVLAGARLHGSGNGGLIFLPGAGALDKHAQVDTECYCNDGYTCGLTNIEVDWDDGSAIDSAVGYLPFTPDFDHWYAQNGLYHIHTSADDDRGNWAAEVLDLTIPG